MPGLPVVSGAKTVRALEKAGWRKVRQKGSHAVLTKPGSIASISGPHLRDLAPGTLRAIIRSAGLTVDEFGELF